MIKNRRSIHRHQLSQVGLKCFITDGKGRLLAVRSRGSKFWDLPGGRVEHQEFPKPLTHALRREMRDEIGKHARVKIHPGGEPEAYAGVSRGNLKKFRFHIWHRQAVASYFHQS